MIENILLNSMSLLFLSSFLGPPEEMIAGWLDLLGGGFLLCCAVQMLRKALKSLHLDQVLGKLREVIRKLGITRDKPTEFEFNTLRIPQSVLVCLKKLQARIESLGPEGASLLKLFFQFQRQVYHHFQQWKYRRGGA